jgi:hypothetical protein
MARGGVSVKALADGLPILTPSAVLSVVGLLTEPLHLVAVVMAQDAIPVEEWSEERLPVAALRPDVASHETVMSDMPYGSLPAVEKVPQRFP